MGTEYIKTQGGITKVVVEVLNLIGFICIVSRNWMSKRGDAFLVASIGGFILTGILFVLHLFDILSKIPLPWRIIECVYCGVWAAFYLIVSALAMDEGTAQYIAGAVFGLFATIVYAVDAYFIYRRGD